MLPLCLSPASSMFMLLLAFIICFCPIASFLVFHCPLNKLNQQHYLHFFPDFSAEKHTLCSLVVKQKLGLYKEL